MFTYEQLERLIGVRKVSDFTNPRVTKSLELEMPINSAVLWYHKEYIGNNLFLKVKNKPKVLPIMKYFKEKPGKFRRLSLELPAMIQKLKKMDTEKQFDFVSSKGKLFLVDRRVPIVFDFYRLEYLYKYQKYRGEEYDKQMNLLNTILSASIEPDRATSRTIYIPVPIPKYIPKLAIIKEALKYSNYKTLQLVKDKDMLLILEMIKKLTSKYNNTSIFNRITNIQESDLKFIFGLNGSITVCSIQNLFALYKENDIISKVKGVDENQAIKLFLYYLLTITTRSTKTLKELDKDTSTDVGVGGTVNDDIDTMIEDHNERQKEVTIEESVVTEKEKSLEEILTEEKGIDADAREFLEEKLEKGIITKKHFDKVMESIKESKRIEEENIITDEDANLMIEEYPDSIIIKDKEMLKNTNTAFAKQYLEKGYKKHQKRVFNQFARIGMVMTNHEVVEKRDVAYAEDTHIISYINNKGREIKIPIIVPAMDEGGVFKLNSNEMIMVGQKADVPIKKISYSTVALNSYYSKSFISKVISSREDISIAIHKQLKKAVDNGDKNIGLMIVGTCTVAAVKLPHMYQVIGRKIKLLKYKGIGLSFDYKTRLNKFKDVDEKFGVVVAQHGKSTYYINMSNHLIKVTNKKPEDLGDIITFIGLRYADLPKEYASMKIMGTTIPMAIILSYYDGITSLMKTLKVRYKSIGERERYTPTEKEYVLRFKDRKLIIESDWYDIVIGGLLSMNDLKYYTFDAMNSESGMIDVVNNMNINSRRLFTELSLMKRLWVDPMTYDLLKRMKEPTTFVGLLYRSIDMLKDDFHKKQNDVSGLVMRRHERLNGMLYHIMAKAVRDNEHKTGMVKTKLTVNPYELKAMLAEDGTFTLVDDLNPFTKLKQEEEITLIGKFGRDKASIASRDRVFDKSSMGYVSEATKDSGQVGVTTYLPGSSKMDNMFGVMKEHNELSISNIVSSSMLAFPYADKDDNKRQLYISVQNSSVVPTETQRVWPVGTGYELLIPYRMGKKFVAYATEEGVVEAVSNKYVSVKYKSGKKKRYKLATWNTKEIGGLSYKHTLVTPLKKGDKLKLYDFIYYDTAFFGVDIFDDKTVVYKGGDTCLVALNENQETYEDSATIDREYAKKFVTNLTSVFSYTIPIDCKLKFVSSVGDKISFGDTLIDFVNNNGFDDGTLNSKDGKEFIASLDNNALRSEAKGVVINIEVYYRAEQKEMSPSIRKFIEEIDKMMIEEKGFTGKVDHTYSIKARPLDEDQVEIKFFLEKKNGMNVGDKAIAMNQLKMTIGEVADRIETADGRRVDYTTSDRSIGARIVNSPYDIASTTTVLMVATEKILELDKI